MAIEQVCKHCGRSRCFHFYSLGWCSDDLHDKKKFESSQPQSEPCHLKGIGTHDCDREQCEPPQELSIIEENARLWELTRAGKLSAEDNRGPQKKLLDREREHLKEIATLRQALEKAEKALQRAEQFMTNGIALGYIRMPDPEVPDTAKETPGIVCEALSGIRKVMKPYNV